MKNTFSVTVNFGNAQELAAYIETVGPLVQSINIVTTPANAGAPVVTHPVRATRGSKVNDTILAALGQRSMTAKELREALEAKGLAPGSLSTGLAQLQRDRRVERLGEGLYGLVGFPAAAE